MAEPSTWKVHVWENLGWHCELLRGPLQVYTTDGKAPYRCLLDSDPDKGPHLGGFMSWTDTAFHSDDPNAAVEHQLKLARAFRKRISRVIKLAEGK
jgi:hypothetical protein